MTINIDELLDSNNERVCIPDHLIELVKSNLEVVPVTIYKLRSKCSEYEYTKEELDWSNDHIRQLVDDILLANLDKVKHLDNRIFNFFEQDKSYWLVKNNELFEVKIDHVHGFLELTCDREYNYILTESVYYKFEDKSIKMFNNDKDFLKFGGQYIYKFFKTKEEGLAYMDKQNG